MSDRRLTDAEIALLRRQVVTEWLIIGLFGLIFVIGAALSMLK